MIALFPDQMSDLDLSYPPAQRSQWDPVQMTS